MLEFVVRVVGVIVAFLVAPLLVGQAEHKVMAHMQSRLGPMYAGAFHGWAQLVADGVKFVQKESVVPAAADRRVFEWAPIVAILPYLAAIAAIPLAPGIVGADLDSGLFFVLAVMSIGVLGSLMAGWGSGNKYSLLGGLRVAAQLMSYELPFVLSAASVAVAAGTLSLTGIAEAWNPWWLLWQLPGMIVFFIAGLAELQRPPFDMPVADSEIIFGAYTEYTGLKFAFFLLAEYGGIVALSAIASVLFLGGYLPLPKMEFIPQPLWMLAKIGALSFLIIWLRVTYPRLREDQLQRASWLLLIPLALLQIVVVAVFKVAF